jgi:hypothetical protein
LAGTGVKVASARRMSFTLTPSARHAQIAASAFATRNDAAPPKAPGRSAVSSSTVSSAPQASTSSVPRSSQVMPPASRWATITGLRPSRPKSRMTG